MPERGFFNFFAIFLVFSCPGRVLTEFETKIFLSLFRTISSFWLKKIPERGFLIFWFFLLFFSEFCCPGRVGTEFGIKIFFFLSFWAYLIPFRLKIMPERGFLIFLLFFSEFSCPGRIRTEFGIKIFLSFSASFNPFWIEIMPELTF